MAVLSEAQKIQFWRDGFLVVEDAVDAGLLRAMQGDFAAWVVESRRHSQPYGDTEDGRPRFDWLTTVTHHDLHHSESRWNFGLYFTWWDRWMGTEHPRYKEEFRKNARPIALPRLPGSFAERLSVTVMALFAALAALGGPFAGVENGLL